MEQYYKDLIDADYDYDKDGQNEVIKGLIRVIASFEEAIEECTDAETKSMIYTKTMHLIGEEGK